MSTIVKDFTINARYDLQAPSVQIFYETASSINGTASLSLVKDSYPNPLPIDPQKQFASLQFTVDLQGISASNTTAKIACHPIQAADPDWWLHRHPQYTPWDPADPADANNNIASFTIDAPTILRFANPSAKRDGTPVVDKGYSNELTSGQLASWMPFQSQRIVIKCKAVVVHRNGTMPQEIPLTFQCLSTNAVTGSYSNQTITAYPEPVPIGLAQFIYEAIAVLQFEGQATLQEKEVSGSLSVGQLFNLTGGALAEWSTMAAMVQQVTENLDDGATIIQFGPPRNLSAGELVDLLRVNRSRIIRSAYSMRPAGTPGDTSASVDLGQNTPEKNSVSGTSPANPHVISASVDGSGAIISHESTGDDCATQWIAQHVPGSSAPSQFGSVDITLSDAGGQDLFIQQLDICQNGVSGTMYFLCSKFVPAP